MYVLVAVVSLDQLFTAREMSQKPQFDLGIVRINKYIPITRNEYFSQLFTFVFSDRNILQVGVCA